MGKSAAQFDPKLTIKLEHSNIWSIKMESNLKNKEITFVDNEEFSACNLVLKFFLFKNLPF